MFRIRMGVYRIFFIFVFKIEKFQMPSNPALNCLSMFRKQDLKPMWV